MAALLELLAGSQAQPHLPVRLPIIPEIRGYYVSGGYERHPPAALGSGYGTLNTTPSAVLPLPPKAVVP
jgi:hypothetical protein